MKITAAYRQTILFTLRLSKGIRSLFRLIRPVNLSFQKIIRVFPNPNFAPSPPSHPVNITFFQYLFPRRLVLRLKIEDAKRWRPPESCAPFKEKSQGIYEWLSKVINHFDMHRIHAAKFTYNKPPPRTSPPP